MQTLWRVYRLQHRTQTRRQHRSLFASLLPWGGGLLTLCCCRGLGISGFTAQRAVLSLSNSKKIHVGHPVPISKSLVDAELTSARCFALLSTSKSIVGAEYISMRCVKSILELSPCLLPDLVNGESSSRKRVFCDRCAREGRTLPPKTRDRRKILGVKKFVFSVRTRNVIG